MLPSMPILFTRDSQDAFGNKIEPSTSYFVQNSIQKPTVKLKEEPQIFIHQKPADFPTLIKPSKPKRKNVKEQVVNVNVNGKSLEDVLVSSYYKKVKSRFSTNLTARTNKFMLFQEILKSFNPHTETPVDLYHKIVHLFGETHKEFVDDFLLFLTPGQAAETGRFMDHLMYVQMTGFIESLQSTLSRKPTVLRKVLRAINRGINTGNCEAMRAQVLPHLRAHPALAEQLKSLIPDERPPDSACETGVETLHESFLTNDDDCEVWEFEDEHDPKRKPYVNGLDSCYLHGRVFLQHGRMLRPACVTYPYSKEPYRVHSPLHVHSHCHLSPAESDEEMSSPKRNKSIPKIPSKRTKKQKKCTKKNVKDVNDNTKTKDCPTVNITNSKTPKGRSQNSTKKVKEKKENETKVETVNKRNRKYKSHTTDKSEKRESVKAKTKMDLGVDTKIKKNDVKNNSWTREEDKTMLQVLKDEAGSEKVFGKIREMLPHRSSIEIKERFCHVMNLLQQMAVGEVT